MLPPIFITQDDARQLHEVVQWAQSAGAIEAANLNKLEAELQRARIVPAEELPADAVTMNSKVLLHDLDTEEDELYTLAYPWAADAENNRISVLAPVGTAMIGCRVGDIIEWPVPAGIRRFRIEDLVFQPEREEELSARR